MIKINGENYKLEEVECFWGEFTRTYHSVTKKGIAPRLFFFVGEESDSKELMLELTITDEEFKAMPLDVELDMKEEVVDIGYADDEGWLSLSGKKCVFKITKLGENNFLMKFSCGDDFEKITFEIEEEITFEYPEAD